MNKNQCVYFVHEFRLPTEASREIRKAVFPEVDWFDPCSGQIDQPFVVQMTERHNGAPVVTYSGAEAPEVLVSLLSYKTRHTIATTITNSGKPDLVATIIEMNLVNMTPHDVNIVDEDGVLIRRYEKSGVYVRAKTPSQAVLGSLGRVPVVAPADFTNAEISNLPNSNVPIIVSILAAPGAAKVYAGSVFTPDTGPASVVRDDKGHIVGVRRLIRYR